MKIKSIIMVTAAIAVTLGVLPINQVSAVTAADWKAGNIIDDGVFTNKNAMSVGQIQSWLDARLKNCDYNGTQRSELSGGTDYDRNGVVTRAEYARTKGLPTKFTCLNMYYEVPKTSPRAGVPASNYASSTRPNGSRSAAQLIYDAAQAYNISPQVLLVKLGTESAGPLTSDVWPLHSQYKYAMGARCPDSGPGGSANCDEQYAGFSIQMREAAELLRWYLDNMTQSWWSYKKPYKTNNILWNVVERNCGGSNVYIENKATAALYTYTPYQPNRAALNNMYGTGDNCSAYGNRNFWRVFNDWFGNTRLFTKGAIGEKYQSIGGTAGLLGEPLQNERCGLSPGGCYQVFKNGSIYWSNQTGAYFIKGSIREKWASTGYQGGFLGYPTSDELCRDGGCHQMFQKGRVLWSPSSGTNATTGAINSRYVSLGAHKSTLAYPTGQEVYDGKGWWQSYQNGAIIGTARTGFWESWGAIRTRWAQLGYQAGTMGYPTGSITWNNDKSAAWQQYQNGFIIWGSTTGAWESKGSIRDFWGSRGYQSGEIGYPIGPETYNADTKSWQQSYQNGVIQHSSRGTSLVP